MDIASRLIKFRDFTELTNSQFADKAGIPRPTLSQFLNGRNKRLSDDLAVKLHSAYPNLNMLWLLFGEGDMLVNENIEISGSKNTVFQPDAERETITTQHITQQKDLFSDIDNPEPIRESYSKEEEADKTLEQKEVYSSKKEPIISTFRSNPQKTVQYVMVFYSDSSFEVFRPNL